jgi:uncharacterized repeat protein (TIGR01451 family)
MSGGGFPPDTNGAPGRNHYIQTINVSFEIWDKQGNSLAGPTGIQSLWNAAGAPAGNQCRSEYFASDPYVQYDHLADRWVMSFGAGATIPFGGLSDFHIMCFAVSQGPNPVTSGWYLYNFDVVKPADYPKFGVWPDGYYMITQEGYNGGNLDSTVFDRGNMLNGNPATFQQKSFFAFTGFGGETVIALPSELTGQLPPGGSPNFYVRPVDGDLFSDGADRIEIWEFHTDWGNPANTTITAAQTLSPAPFDSSCDAAGDNALGQDCINQPGTTNLLDGLTTWPRSPLQYRNFGDHETITLSHGVNVTGGTPGIVGMRWYEIRRTPPGSGSWVLYQQGTFEPTDAPNSSTTTIHRWNGSVAIDAAGNMALGYNVSNDGSNGSVAPGIRYVGRLVTDALGEMTTSEITLATGSGFIPSSGDPKNPNDRWGDYSMMRLDPVDGCTFWYTSEFLSGGGQASQVGAFRFPTCNPADLTITKSGPATVTAGTQFTYTINVVNNGTATATNVIVTDTLPPGVTLVSTSAVCNSGTVTTGCNIGSLASGAGSSFTMLVQLSSAASGIIKNTVTVSSDELDPNPSDNTATATSTVITSADLSITKVCKPDTVPAVAGTTAFCTMVVTNNGPSDANGVTLNDSIVASTPFTIGTVTTTQGSCTATPGTITSGSVACNFGTITAGGTATVTVNVSALNGGNINDTATVTSSTPDPNTANNTATGALTYISSADVSITKTSAPNPVVAGTNLTYTITAHNAGPSTAPNVVVKDTLPAQIAVVSATPSVGSCSGGIPGNPAQPLICTLGSLTATGPGSTATITVVVKVNSATPDGTILINNASIASDAGDPNNGNNVATASAPVVARADLSIVKTSDKHQYKPSSVVTYTITVTNNGPSDALAVIVTDTLPADKQAHYQSDTGGCTLTVATNVLTCNLGTMPTGTNKSFNIYELINGNQGSISNTASVAGSTTDPNSANNTSTLVVAVK